MHEHWIVAKKILIYLCGMQNYGLRYVSSSDVQLHGYTNSNWASRKNKLIALMMIQVDIGGHPPIPLGPTPLFLSVFQFP
jgi:hypothetical protein